MIIFVAHSMALKIQAEELREKLVAVGHEVLMPTHPEGKSERQIVQENATLIGRSGTVLGIWSGISDGCPMDVAMAIALGKPVWAEMPKRPIPLSGYEAQGAGPQIGKDVMVRAWALFEELPKIEEWWYNQG